MTTHWCSSSGNDFHSTRISWWKMKKEEQSCSKKMSKCGWCFWRMLEKRVAVWLTLLIIYLPACLPCPPSQSVPLLISHPPTHPHHPPASLSLVHIHTHTYTYIQRERERALCTCVYNKWLLYCKASCLYNSQCTTALNIHADKLSNRTESLTVLYASFAKCLSPSLKATIFLVFLADSLQNKQYSVLMYLYRPPDLYAI